MEPQPPSPPPGKSVLPKRPAGLRAVGDMQPTEGFARPGLLGTVLLRAGIFVGSLAGVFAGIEGSIQGMHGSSVNDPGVSWSDFSIPCVFAGTILVAFGLRPDKARWAVGAFFGFLVLMVVGAFAGCAVSVVF